VLRDRSRWSYDGIREESDAGSSVPFAIASMICVAECVSLMRTAGNPLRPDRVRHWLDS
jgi:hypothetical protein